MSDRLNDLRDAVTVTYKCPVILLGSFPIKETYQGKTVWEGVVNLYDITNHPKVNRAYAWSFKQDDGSTQHVVISETPPVTDAFTAVRAYIASLGRKAPGA